VTKKKAHRSAALILAAKSKARRELPLADELAQMLLDVVTHNDNSPRSEVVTVEAVLRELESAGVKASRRKLEQYAVHTLGRVSWSKP
jgi:hypothetical protein